MVMILMGFFFLIEEIERIMGMQKFGIVLNCSSNVFIISELACRNEKVLSFASELGQR